MKEFSKKLLLADYIVALVLIIGFFVCVALNGFYVRETIDIMVNNGIDISCLTSTPQLYSLDGFGILLGAWIIQLGVSSGAYYMMCKGDHKVQLPMILLNDIPDDIKDKLDLTQIVTTLLSTSDN